MAVLSGNGKLQSASGLYPLMENTGGKSVGYYFNKLYQSRPFTESDSNAGSFAYYWYMES